MFCSCEVLPPSIWWMACRPNTSLHLERVSAPISGMLLRPRCARCTSRWLVLKDHAALGQVVGLSDAISNSNREVDPPGGLTKCCRAGVRSPPSYGGPCHNHAGRRPRMGHRACRDIPTRLAGAGTLLVGT